MVCNFEGEIERLRYQLIKTAQQEGLHHERTIALSRKLDRLINKYEQEKMKNKMKNM
ncbi:MULTISPECIES: aspartyl-phosphate phosphatase Spo0E family protein [unclassified Sporosarcina]|uniref:aspartyl-phosphate phosphatase Spo0E family protein n=1 Tax=unclassified Sporosarcina TaxID=2647733 RepID=UPI0013042FDF|nr:MULTISPECIES: aspartyl-phosphate phosphatase Spo0E family protein [unclassified Sporosarcina]